MLTATLAACASTSTDNAPDKVVAVSETEKEKPKMRCRREQSTGSRLGERICTPVGD